MVLSDQCELVSVYQPGNILGCKGATPLGYPVPLAPIDTDVP